MSEPTVVLERERTRLGEPVRGALIAAEDSEQASVRLALRLWEQTPRSRAIGIETPAVTIHDGPLSAGAKLPFTVTPPSDGYPSYTSPSGATSLSWEVVALLDRGRSERITTAPLIVDAAPG